MLKKTSYINKTTYVHTYILVHLFLFIQKTITTTNKYLHTPLSHKFMYP